MIQNKNLPKTITIRNKYLKGYENNIYTKYYRTFHTFEQHLNSNKRSQLKNKNAKELKHTTYGYKIIHRYDYSMLWDLVYKELKRPLKQIEFKNHSKYRNGLLNKYNTLEAYVFRVNEKHCKYYIKLVYDTVTKNINFVSFHLANSGHQGFNQLKA